MKLLSQTQLEKLNTPRLLNILKSTRAIIHSIQSGNSCPLRYRMRDCCSEHGFYHSPETIDDVLWPLKNYFSLLKSILATREHVN